MRGVAVVLALAACGDNGAKRDAGPRDTLPTADAPPLIACTPRSGSTVSVRKIGSVTGPAVLATSPPNDGRLFVLEQAGRIRVFENEQLRATPFLDISDLVAFSLEQGLLGLAFHPRYAENRMFFVYYTTDTANVLARYTVSQTDLDVADAAGEVILSIPDYASNHNGGMIEFGADGLLYISTGDGGQGGDPCLNGQAIDRDSEICKTDFGACPGLCEPLLGKILRIDVGKTSANRKYGIPGDNPFASGGGEPEIFMRGLRNPWRWAFDRATGDMYIGDVGQDTDEELTVLAPADQNGANFGWSQYEGTRPYRAGADPAGITMPQFVRNHDTDGWKCVIGGDVYRGSCFPDLAGSYFFTDFVRHPLMRGRFDGATLSTEQLPLPPSGDWPENPTSIHADARGELFMTTLAGEVYQIEAGP
jgi:glucose/arabinose dehydrogenase